MAEPEERDDIEQSILIVAEIVSAIAAAIIESGLINIDDIIQHTRTDGAREILIRAKKKHPKSVIK